MQDKNSTVNSIANDDLDFNIEEVEQVIAPQIDTGGSDEDTSIGDEEPAAAGGVSISKKKWCC
jgi:hypothetical protein